MARKADQAVDESSLSKGQMRKLTALRKSLGDAIADKAFTAWIETVGTHEAVSQDSGADTIMALLAPKVLAGEIKIPRGGYIIRRGHGRVIVERAS